MRRTIVSILATLMLVCSIILPAAAPRAAAADSTPSYKLGVSIYVGWMPWYYAMVKGVMEKHAAAEGIRVEISPMDYIPSVEAFVSGKVDACVMTNMECLDMPAASGIDCTVSIVGDYSNGNDACLTRGIDTVEGLRGQDILLVENSVSHYGMARMLEKHGMTERDVTIVNTSDSDIGPAFIGNESQKAVFTWNPIVMQIAQTPGVTNIFDSSSIPGEILDLMVVRTDVLQKDPRLGRALSGAWYEILGLMSQRGKEADKAMKVMAELGGSNLTEYKQQLKTTAMFWTPESAVAFTTSKELQEKMEFVRQFCFKHGLLGLNAKSVDVVGISYPDGTVQGNPKNIKMRFVTTFMQGRAGS